MAGSYLSDGNVDDLARMVTALTTELWIVKDRLAVVERLYGEKIGIDSQAVDDFIPDKPFAEQTERLRDVMVNAVIGAPLAARERSVDDILARAGMKRPAQSSMDSALDKAMDKA
jgi:hypothetical protein